jgi:hypothetical protein
VGFVDKVALGQVFSLRFSVMPCDYHSTVAVPWLRRLVAGLSPRRPGFAPVSVHVGFVDKVALGQVFSLRFSVMPCDYHSTVAVPWLRRLVAGLSPRRSGFAPVSVHVGFVVDKVALGQVFLRVLRVSSVSIITPSLSNSYHLGNEQYVRCRQQLRDVVSPHRHEQVIKR